MKLIEWLGGLMLIIAFLEFAASPRQALKSITEVLSTNVYMQGNHLALKGPHP